MKSQYEVMLAGGSGLFQPHAGDAGFDLSVLEGGEVGPMELREFRTGVRVALPPDLWLRLTARSSTIRKMRLLVVDGVIDAGFRGELLVAVLNLGSSPVEVEPGMRLAQVIPHLRVAHQVKWLPVADSAMDLLPQWDGRGRSGFGSSGSHHSEVGA